MFFDNFMLKNFSYSDYINQFRDCVLTNKAVRYNIKDFKDTVSLPFEKIKIPVPVGYDRILTTGYGDWHKLIFTHAHVLDYSVNISSFDYFAAKEQKIFSVSIDSTARVLTGDYPSE